MTVTSPCGTHLQRQLSMGEVVSLLERTQGPRSVLREPGELRALDILKELPKVPSLAGGTNAYKVD